MYNMYYENTQSKEKKIFKTREEKDYSQRNKRFRADFSQVTVNYRRQ